MLETSDSEIDVDRLMHEIRETVARQHKQATDEHVRAPLEPFSSKAMSGSTFAVDPSPLSLQPEFHRRPDNQYHVDDLLKYHGTEFVRNAYRAILNREPDAAGWAQHLENLASGRFNKVDVLASLHYSPEGKRAKVEIDGLSWPVTIRRLGRAPIIGYLIQLAIAVARLPRLLQYQRQSEFYLSAQQQQIVDHDNKLHKQLAESLTQISAQTEAGAERATNHHQLLESLSQQQQELAARQIEFSDTVEARFSAARQNMDQSAAALTQRLDQSMVEVTQQLEARAAALTRHVDQNTAALTQQLEARATALTQHVDQNTAELTRQVEARIEELLRLQQKTHTELVMQERRLTLLLEKAREQPPGDFAQPLAQQMVREEDHLLDVLYASFEDQFRGEREEVKDRLRVYLPLLQRAGVLDDVLDIGSGRGEWLELLKVEGVQARGVDRNRVFIQRCTESGLDVVEDDALAYLRNTPDQSLSAITSFHLVEHLPFEMLVKLLDEMVRTLKSGGLLILETPDPENFMVGSYNFYADPTHRNPIPSPTLKFLLEARGLARTKVMKLRPWDAAKLQGDTEIIKRFNEYFYSAPDYGIIGWKN